jgi:hypothetical protein
MAWPPAYSAAFIGTGATTIKWGTDGIMSVNAPNGSGGGVGGFYTVESIRPADKIDTLYIEQGSGLEATRIQLWQGRRITLTVVDDTNFTPPGPSTNIQIIDPLSSNLLTFRVIDNGSTGTRKLEHKRELTVEYLTLIEGAGTVPPA